MTPETTMLAALAAPGIGAALIAVCRKVPNLRDAVSLLTSLALVFLCASLVDTVRAGERATVRLLEFIPGAPVAFAAEPLGVLFALMASSLWVVTTVYSIGYMRANAESHQTRFYACFALALGCVVGIALAANLLTMFLFYEALTLVTYPLVTHHGDQEARAAGRLYLGLLLSTSMALLLPALVLTWHVAGTLDFAPHGILTGKLSPQASAMLLALFVLGTGKAALMPVHRWLPAAMVAPAPVSALLHAVAVVKAGVFVVFKVMVQVFGTAGIAAQSPHWLPWLASFTILTASLVALRADNLKRRLAYSTVSQLAYIVLAAALTAPAAIVGAALHIVAHAVGKITLFFAAGAIYTATQTTEVSQMVGVGRRMPWTLAAFTIGALSVIGVPPAIGFFSKWSILVGAVEAGQLLLVVVLMTSTLLSAAYLLPVVHVAFFRGTAAPVRRAEAPWPLVLATVITAVAALTLPFVTEVPLELARLVESATR